LEHAARAESVLLISPTGGGKTLAGFLPSLVELSSKRERRGIHTLYISPLKALAVDIARNLEAPVREMALPVTVETRTGDTPHSKRKRQREKPPDILITTPEQVSLLVADPGAAHMLGDLSCIVLDELHAIVTSKRGVLLSLALTRVSSHAPQARRIGLSATVADPDALRAWLVPSGMPPAPLVMGAAGAPPHIRILKSVERVPWSGHSSLYAIAEIYEELKRAKLTLVFVNTRSQAEMLFQSLWEANDDHLPIALHHGSLDVAQRRKVEAAMAAGKLRAVVCTSTLDLGIDWGDVDLVIHVGAPKGSASSCNGSATQSPAGRAKRARCRLNPSVLECEAARQWRRSMLGTRISRDSRSTCWRNIFWAGPAQSVSADGLQGSDALTTRRRANFDRAPIMWRPAAMR
jgi:ATP-dependent Lhr-like helicase